VPPFLETDRIVNQVFFDLSKCVCLYPAVSVYLMHVDVTASHDVHEDSLVF
jgi:hypothetical protein